MLKTGSWCHGGRQQLTSEHHKQHDRLISVHDSGAVVRELLSPLVCLQHLSACEERVCPCAGVQQSSRVMVQVVTPGVETGPHVL
jgi:hypothetical protein